MYTFTAAFPQPLGAVRAGHPALAAADAFRRVELDLWRRADAFRAVAAVARQRTALEEHGTADARAVMDRKALDVEDDAGARHIATTSQNPAASRPA